MYTTTTNANGNYLISVPENDTYVVRVSPPTGYVPTANSNDNSVVDTTSENNLSHEGNGTRVVIDSTDNLSVDFGFRVVNTVLGTTTCDEVNVNDDRQAANENNPITTIDVLSNDTGTKVNQTIKFLALNTGRTLWENKDKNISAVPTFTTLTVAGEGTWTVKNNQIVFTALTSFDGQIPTPIYYIIEGGTECSDLTRYSNVGQVTINTPCTCPSYVTKSVSTYNIFGIILLILLTLIINRYARKEKI